MYMTGNSKHKNKQNKSLQTDNSLGYSGIVWNSFGNQALALHHIPPS